MSKFEYELMYKYKDCENDVSTRTFINKEALDTFIVLAADSIEVINIVEIDLMSDNVTDTINSNVPDVEYDYEDANFMSVQTDEMFNWNDSRLQWLMKNIDSIKSLFENKNTRESDSIVIDLPKERSKDFRKTFRINDVVYNDFKRFCNQNQQFAIKDLLSLALKEFIEKYDKV